MIDFWVDMRVSNTGAKTANHTVLLYFIQPYRRVTPEENRLLSFDKVQVQAGGHQDVRFALNTKALSYIGVGMDRVVETGDYYIALGDPQYGPPPTDTNACVTNGLCVKLTVSSSPACEAASNGVGPCQIPVNKAKKTTSPADTVCRVEADTAGKMVIPHWAFLVLILVAGVSGGLFVAVLPLLSDAPGEEAGVAHVELDEEGTTPRFEQLPGNDFSKV